MGREGAVCGNTRVSNGNNLALIATAPVPRAFPQDAFLRVEETERLALPLWAAGVRSSLPFACRPTAPPPLAPSSPQR